MRRIKQSKLFGTDGIRSRAGHFPLDRESIIKLGNAIGETLKGSRIVIGRDTRNSGEEIEEYIAAGISGSAQVFTCGVIPTPGLSYITANGDYDCGIMITASHNPSTDNGIKMFNSVGEKISPDLQQDIEDIFFTTRNPWSSTFDLEYADKDIIKYIDFLASHTTGLRGNTLKVVLDCANGAAYEIAPAIFAETGLDLSVIHATPNGENINLDCGSTKPERLVQAVAEHGAELGIAFDGDADRVIFADNAGHVLNGDHTLYVIAKYFMESDTCGFFNKTVVGTVMANLGLEKKLNRMGVKFIRTSVGDANVYREMKRIDAVIGGEQSGHTILRTHQGGGDGILTALFFIRALFYLGLHPGGIYEQLPLCPQVQRDIMVKEKRNLDKWDKLQQMLADFSRKYGETSRIVIRYSGTEPKLRLMMESEDETVLNENIDSFEEIIKSSIGV